MIHFIAMRGWVLACGLGGALTAFGVARADETPTPASTEQSATQKPADEVVCKRLGAPTGSRIGDRKVCKPRQVWDDESRAAQEATKALQDKSAAQNLGMTPG
jgi:Flp pilus assembly protein CpaB